MTPRKYVPADKPSVNELAMLAVLLTRQERAELLEWLRNHIEQESD